MASTPRVLVIEDDEDYAFLIVEALEREDRFRVDAIERAAQLTTLSLADYQAVVLDNNLPDATGMELLSVITASCDAAVVFMTGDDVVRVAVEAIRNGAFSYLVKDPQNLVLLPEVVGQAVDECRRRVAFALANEALARERASSSRYWTAWKSWSTALTSPHMK